MDKIIFENLPSEETAVSAENLNLMQSNIEKSVVAVSPTQPTTNENVWIKKGKNLFDNTFIQMRDDAPSTTRVEGKKIPLENVFDTPQAVSLSNNLNLSTYKWSVNIKTNTGGNYDYDSGWIENANNWTVSQSRISEFMSRGNPQIYFVIAKKDETNIYVSEMNNYNFQIEVSTTATTFEPHVEKEILVKNDNGEFEKFVNVETLENLFDDTSSKGYQKLPSGLILQWGNVSIERNTNSEQDVNINFPKTFSQIYTVVATLNDPGHGATKLTENVGVPYIYNSYFTARFKKIEALAYSSNMVLRYIAIGI